MKNPTINIAIVEDHDLFREGIQLILRQIPGFNVVFASSDAQKFIESLGTTAPDVVLMDINLPVMDGITATERALRKAPDLKVIALTMFADTHHYTRMIHAGAKGFVLKQAPKQELQEAITAVHAGGSHFSQEILIKIAKKPFRTTAGSDELTARELDVLDLVCRGMTTQEIAGKLFISEKTVEAHRSNIFQKTNVRNTAELILWAVKRELFIIE